MTLKVTNYSIICCCGSAYLSSCQRTASDANLLDDPHTFHYNDYFVIGGICTCLGVSDDPMFLWVSSNSCPLNLLLVRSHQAEVIIVKRLVQERNNVTRVELNPDHLIRVVVKTTPLPIWPRCRLLYSPNRRLFDIAKSKLEKKITETLQSVSIIFIKLNLFF